MQPAGASPSPSHVFLGEYVRPLAIAKPRVAAKRLRHFADRALDSRLSADERERCRREAENLDDQLRQAVRCRRCGLRLEDPESVRLGLGPDCRKRVTV